MSTMLLVVARHNAWKGPSVRPSIWKAMAMTIAAMTNVYLTQKSRTCEKRQTDEQWQKRTAKASQIRSMCTSKPKDAC